MMGNPKRNWKKLVADHATKLGVKARLTGDGIGKYERVHVACDHRSYSVIACCFVVKQFCCRAQARINQPGRENVGEAISKALTGRVDSFETRLKKAEVTRSRVGTVNPDKPDLLYLGSRDGFIKIGRCAECRALRWFKELNLYVIDAWELPQFAAGILERKIHDKFGHLRLLDPGFGKGWTEVFNIDPQLVISFIENELRSDITNWDLI